MLDGAMLASLQPQVVARWAADPCAARVLAVEGTVVSADISGFTRLAESLGAAGPRLAAETLNATINRCFEPMIDEVLRRGGDVVKFGGDAMFILFDGRLVTDHAVQAAAAANRLQQVLASIDAGEDAALSMTVGVATGSIEMILAGTDRRELVIHGPTVDECLRLENDAEPGETLVAATTAARLPADWLDATDPDVTLLVGPQRGDQPTAAPLPEPATSVSADDRSAVDWPTVIGPELSAAAAAYDGTHGELRMVTVAFVEFPTADVDPQVVFHTVDRADRVCRLHGVTLLSTDVARGGIKMLICAGAPTAGDADQDAMLAAIGDIVLAPDAPPMRAGVNRGVVYAGFLGSDRCRTFTVMGDPTNLAARLLGKAELGTVAVSAPVLDSARSTYPTSQLPPMLVKGRLTPVTVHRLHGPATARRTPDLRPTFVGRHAEIDRIRNACAALRDGVGSSLCVVGESGVGASRLIDEALAELPIGILRLDLTHTLPGPTPYAAVTPFLRALAGLSGSADEQIATLRSWWEHNAPPGAVDRLPLVAPAFGVDVPGSEATDAIKAEYRQATINAEVADAVAAVLTGPTVLIAEDAHHHDAASIALCQAIADRCAERPWLVITSTRPDATSIDTGEVITLEPLAHQHTRELIAELSDLPEGRQRLLAEQSGGNPLFAIELVNVDRGGIEHDVEGAAGQDLTSIEALVTHRIDRLGHEARVLLRMAAVLGRRFSLEQLRAVLIADGAAPETLDGLSSFATQLRRLVDSDPGANDGTWYTFRSSVIHRVAYEGLSDRRSRELHTHAAELLERERAAPADLAWHHLQAGNTQRAFTYSRQAAERARSLGSMTEVVEHLGRAVAAAERGGAEAIDEQDMCDVLCDLFYAEVATNRQADAVAIGRRALERLGDGVERARLLFRSSFVTAEYDGSYGQQIEFIGRELDRLGDDEEHAASRAWLAAGLASLHSAMDAKDDALAAAERAVREADVAHTPGPAASALLTRHLVLTDRAHPDRDEAALALIDAARAADDPDILIAAHNNIGLDLQDRGRWDEALGHYTEAIALAEHIGDTRRRVFLAVNRAALLVDKGNWDAARPELDELRREASYGGGGSLAAWVKLELARLEIHAGRADAARPWIAEAERWYTSAATDSDLYELALLSMAADLADGRSADVLAAAARLRPIDDIPPHLLGGTALSKGYALLQQARAEEALAEFESAVADTDDAYLFGHARALVGRSEAERDLGRSRSSQRTRTSADVLLGQLGVEALPLIPLPR